MDALKCIIGRGVMSVRITLKMIGSSAKCWIGPSLGFFQVDHVDGHCCRCRCRRSPPAGCIRTSARGNGTALVVSNKGATPVSRAACSGRLTLASDVWRRVQEAFGSPKGVYQLGRLQEILFRDLKAFIALNRLRSRTWLALPKLLLSIWREYLSDVVQVLPEPRLMEFRA
jgi:hypothetical protein